MNKIYRVESEMLDYVKMSFMLNAFPGCMLFICMIKNYDIPS